VIQSAPLRGTGPALKLPIEEMRRLFDTGRVECVMGVVTKPEGQPHCYIEDGHVFVEVVTAPEGLDLTCQLAVPSTGPNAGLWFWPAVGAKVLVAIPSGQIDHSPTVVAVEASGEVPEGFGDQNTIFKSLVDLDIRAPTTRIGPKADKVEINEQHTYVKNGDIQLGPSAGGLLPMDGVVTGKSIDTYTGVSYWVLGFSSTITKAEK
jgi:hypothetical protein